MSLKPRRETCRIPDLPRLMPPPASASDSMDNRSRRRGDSLLRHRREQCEGRQGGMPWWQIWPTHAVACCLPQLLSTFERTKVRGAWSGRKACRAQLSLLATKSGNLAGRGTDTDVWTKVWRPGRVRKSLRKRAGCGSSVFTKT